MFQQLTHLQKPMIFEIRILVYIVLQVCKFDNLLTFNIDTVGVFVTILVHSVTVIVQNSTRYIIS